MARRLARLSAAGALLSAILLVAASARAERLCGLVSSSGQPVEGAQVVAMRAGRVASTGVDGRFCLEDLDGGTQRLRVFALGFQPGERLVDMGDAGSDVRFELIPLRPVSPGGRFAPGSAEPGKRRDPDFRSDVPLVAADSVWLHEGAFGPCGDDLRALHGTLRALSSAESEDRLPRFRELANRARALRRRCCSDTVRVERVPPSACEYLDRAWIHARFFAAYLDPESFYEDGPGSELERRLSHADPAVSGWAERLREALRLLPTWTDEVYVEELPEAASDSTR